MEPFAFDLQEEDIKRERRKAKELKASRWWKQRLAKGVCGYCGQKIPPKELTMDHIVPVSRGGITSKGNVMQCCKKCNNKKKELLLMEWEEYLKGIQKGQA